MLRIRNFLFLAFFALCFAVPSHAAPFPKAEVDYSGDMYITMEKGVMVQKVFNSGQKSRTEMRNSLAIVRKDKNVVWVLMPQSNSFMEIPMNQEHLPPTERPDISWKEVGKETVNGYPATKYHFESDKKGGTMEGFVWVTKEGIVVKYEGNTEHNGKKTKMVSELKNLKIGKQDGALFEIPKGFKKSPMPSGMGAGGMPPKRPH